MSKIETKGVLYQIDTVVEQVSHIPVPAGGVTYHDAHEIIKRLFAEDDSEREMGKNLAMSYDPVINKDFFDTILDTEYVRSKFDEDFLKNFPFKTFERLHKEFRERPESPEKQYGWALFMVYYCFWGELFKDHDFITPYFQMDLTSNFEVYE